MQTFGHLEFLLKHDKWRGLREVETFPSSMCPSHSESLLVVRNMIAQIVKSHPNIQYIHIGADEVWHMGMCSTCERRIQCCKNGKADLFLEHVTNVAQYIKDYHPSLKIIMWDDMLRNIDTKIIQGMQKRNYTSNSNNFLSCFIDLEYNIGSLVEPMVWHYNSFEMFSLGSTLWDKYSNIFPNIWIATAYKGATGCSQVFLLLNQTIRYSRSKIFYVPKLLFRYFGFE